MPLKLNVSASRKVADGNYGSRGASVSLELELDAALAREPMKLRHHIRQMFNMVSASVAEELKANGAPGSNGSHASAMQPRSKESSSGSARPATASQVKAIHAIARGQQANLLQLLRERFQVSRPDDLTLSEASRLIDELKQGSTG